MAFLHHERQHAEADESGQDRRDGCRQRDHDRAERHREHEERDPDDVQQEPRQALHDLVGDIRERRGQAGDIHGCVPAFGRRRYDVAAQGVDQPLRPLVLRREGRLYEDDGDGLRVVVDRLVDGGDTREAARGLDDPLRRVGVAVHIDDDRDGGVEAGAEALG